MTIMDSFHDLFDVTRTSMVSTYCILRIAGASGRMVSALSSHWCRRGRWLVFVTSVLACGVHGHCSCINQMTLFELSVESLRSDDGP